MASPFGPWQDLFSNAMGPPPAQNLPYRGTPPQAQNMPYPGPQGPLDPWTQAMMGQQQQYQQQRAWADYVYSQWMPQQFQEAGGGGGMAAPNLGAELGSFRGLMGSPNAAEAKAGQSYLGDLLGGGQAALNAGARANPSFAGQAGLAEAQYLQQLQGQQFTAQQQAEQQRTSALQQLAQGVAAGNMTPQQAEVMASNFYGVQPGQLGFLQQLVPTGSTMLDAADTAAISKSLMANLAPVPDPANPGQFKLAMSPVQAAALARAQLAPLYGQYGPQIEQAIMAVLGQLAPQSPSYLGYTGQLGQPGQTPAASSGPAQEYITVGGKRYPVSPSQRGAPFPPIFG